MKGNKMSKDKILVEYSDALRHAVNSVVAAQRTNVDSAPRKSGRSALTDRRGGGGGGVEYNGPYKMILDGNRVRIVDGATYNPATKTSDKMLVYVNGCTLYAEPFTSQPKISSATFAMCFTSRVDVDGNYDHNVTPYVQVVDLSIEHNNEMPGNTVHQVWKRIGRLLVDDNNGITQYVISQDHASGDMELSWYAFCWDEQDVVDRPR